VAGALSARRLIAAIALALSLTAPRLLHAQQRGSLDIGYVSIAYDSTTRASGVTLAPALRLARSTATLGADGTLSLFDAGGWSAQGTLMGSAFTPSFHMLRGEIAGAASGSAFEGSVSTSQLLGQARLHLLGARQGAWLAVGGGQGWDGLQSRAIGLAGVGAWVRRGRSALAASVTPTAVGDLHYTDATVSLSWTAPTLELAGSLTARSGGDVVRGGAWANANATFWLSRHVAFVAGWGNFAPDPGQALPGGRYITMSFRLGTRPVRHPEIRIAPPKHAPARPGVARDFEVRPRSDGQCVIRVRVARATRVEVMGDFSDWRAVSLVHVSRDEWETAMPVAPGTHHFDVRVDGGEWDVPAETPSMNDDFNGRVGVFLVR